MLPASPNNRKLVIAIDGYSSCGKSTLAKDVALALQIKYVDSGAMYRAVALYFIENHIHIPTEQSTQSVASVLQKINLDFFFNHALQQFEITLNGKFVEHEIRSMHVADVVSNVSALKEVRSFLIAKQQELGSNGGVVMDGRDIGTAVFPNADLKFFMTAKPEIRAQRRLKELQNKNLQVSFEEVLANLHQRDLLDTTRKTNPLTCAADAIVIDNSHLTRQEQLQIVLDKVRNLQTVQIK
ncbi:MAG: (d)CMP kinase [Bacteroidia bacterium]|nr:(d)CMP kinase [Bacteroidia bacterium]HQV00584.1 (d)CMP kinase [Bacteroidia bacterium]